MHIEFSKKIKGQYFLPIGVSHVREAWDFPARLAMFGSILIVPTLIIGASAMVTLCISFFALAMIFALGVLVTREAWLNSKIDNKTMRQIARLMSICEETGTQLPPLSQVLTFTNRQLSCWCMSASWMLFQQHAEATNHPTPDQIDTPIEIAPSLAA